MMCYCNTTNFNSRILCVSYRILSKTSSLVSMKCHCTATVDNVHAETLQVYLLYTKIIHIHMRTKLCTCLTWHPLKEPLKEVVPLQIDLSLWLAKLSSLCMLFLHVYVSGFPGPSNQHIYMYIFSTSPLAIYTCIHHSQVFMHRKWLVDYSPCFLCSLQNSGNFNQILKQGYKYLEHQSTDSPMCAWRCYSYKHQCWSI